MSLAATLQGLPNLNSHPRVQLELQRAGKYSPTIATALLVIAIAWQLARITWLLLPVPPNNAPVIVQSSANQIKPTRSIDVQKIADAHLFGSATAGDNADVSNAPQTQMVLVLAGVMAAPDPTKGFAFIGESAATAKLLHVGETVGGSAKLHSVYIDRVMLDRGGRLESLILPRYSGSTAPLITATPPPAPTRFANDARHLMETNPSAFSEIVRAQPVFTGSKLQGYRVYPGRNRQQFARMGLHPGDLVTAVSGTPLTDQSSAMQIFNTISSTDRVSLTVERDGQPQQVTVNTAQIDLPEATSNGTPPAVSGAPPPSPRVTSDGTPGVIAPEVQ